MIHRNYRRATMIAALAAALPAVAQPPAIVPSPAVPAAASAPAPGSPGVFVSGQQLAVQLQAAIAKSADPALAELSATDQYAIHEVHRSKPAPAAIHPGWTELHFILEGGGTLVTGGRMASVGGKNTVEGGVAQEVKKGDAVIVPPNTPHMYSRVDGTLTYLEVRFVAPSAAAAAK